MEVLYCFRVLVIWLTNLSKSTKLDPNDDYIDNASVNYTLTCVCAGVSLCDKKVTTRYSFKTLRCHPHVLGEKLILRLEHKVQIWEDTERLMRALNMNFGEVSRRQYIRHKKINSNSKTCVERFDKLSSTNWWKRADSYSQVRIRKHFQESLPRACRKTVTARGMKSAPHLPPIESVWLQGLYYICSMNFNLVVFSWSSAEI